ncbi:glycosyltransferase family 2 protein [Corallococcus sp. bb12-1]|uniref:glycosyltransferase family 2 protein n=1 Tax=Corallococcus sp. bb12-1 TaxID=2996784 RepID=UPI00226F8375|nr:glycosyltransferase family 2 protein [Corallococcus sp. bb12-1]MCY1042963.1 glycosyltransferase family 2 protein [Corallococcus sp. bb12-1]
MNAIPEAVPTADAGERLTALVLSRVRAGAVVCLVGGSTPLAAALRTHGCDVREQPGPGWTRPEGAEPSHVVLTGDAVAHVLTGGLEVLRQEAPRAEVLFQLRNAGAARALLETWLGTAPVRAGISEQGMLRRLSDAGYRIAHREVLPCASRSTPLAEDTEQALRALLAQLSPSTQVEEGLYAVVPEAPARALEPGLLSVVLVHDPRASAATLDEALFALACQEQQPLELLLAVPEGGELSAAEASLRRYATLGTFQPRMVRAPAGDLHAEAFRQARGQYLALLDARCLVYPRHYTRLVHALQEGSAAWAVARSFRTEWASGSGAMPYVRAKVPFPLGEQLEVQHFATHPELIHALVIDRTRIGPFPLTGVGQGGGVGDLAVRLGALFVPVFLAGIASCEVRGPCLAQGVGAAPVASDPWLLRRVSAWTGAVGQAREEALLAREFRHRLVDGVNARLHAIPWVHDTLRALADRLKLDRNS